MALDLRAHIPAGPLESKWERHRFELKLVNPANKRRFDVIVGVIMPDGSFVVESADGFDRFEGHFNPDWSGEAVNLYTDLNGCVTQYDVEFTP